MLQGGPLRLGLFDVFQVDPTDPDDTAAVDRRRLADLALADELGFDLARTAERHFLGQYRCPAPGAWLAATSQRTTRRRLGVLAETLPPHPPAALAEEIAVLDQLTGGRLESGLGLGHRTAELRAVGLDPATGVAAYQEHRGRRGATAPPRSGQTGWPCRVRSYAMTRSPSVRVCFAEAGPSRPSAGFAPEPGACPGRAGRAGSPGDQRRSSDVSIRGPVPLPRGPAHAAVGERCGFSGWSGGQSHPLNLNR